MKMRETPLSKTSRTTVPLVWIIVPLMPLILAVVALQPTSALLDSAWIRSLQVRPSEATAGFRVAFFFAHLIAYSPLLFALVKLGLLARAYARGKVFVDEAASALWSAAWALIVLPVVLPVTILLFAVFLAQTGLLSSARIAVHVQLEWLLIAAIGLVMRLVALAMKDAVVIAREHQEYV